MVHAQASVYHRRGRVRTAEGIAYGWTIRGEHVRRLRGHGEGFPLRQRDCIKRRAAGRMRVATTFERVRGIVADRLGVDEEKVTMEAEFIGDLNADSLDLVEVIMAMEQEFDIEIKDEDAENIRTVADAVQYIDEHGG
jgi:acyl carrier protein